MPDTETLFPGFREHKTGPIFARVGGDGPPLLVLHGYPQTGAMWHKIAPGLAEEHTLVVADLLGYGASDSPPGDGGQEAYSKRAMARYMVDLMADLGFDHFRLAGHDRGGRVAYRLTLDHPERVERLALLDIIPTAEQFEQMGIAGGLGGFHWYFLAQPAPLPERLISAEPEFFLKRMLGSWAGEDDQTVFTESAMAEYLAAAHDPETVRSWCEDYRSGARFDLALDRAGPLGRQEDHLPLAGDLGCGPTAQPARPLPRHLAPLGNRHRRPRPALRSLPARRAARPD